MSNETVSVLFQQLAYQTPILLIFLAGAVWSGMTIRKHPTPSMWCLLGCAISFVSALAVTGIQAWLLGARMSQGGSIASYGPMMSTVGMVGAIARSIGLALIVIAVFLGRASATKEA